MSSGTGDMKVLGNFRRLIDQVSADPNYNPSNVTLAKASLETQYAAALAAVEDVATKMAPHKIATGQRIAAFEDMTSLLKRSRNLLKASGAPKEVLDSAETLARKLLGKRKSPKAQPVLPVADKPETPANEAGLNHSTSQMSYDNRLGNLSGYLAILSSATSYQPNEDDLKMTSLKTMAANLRARNDAVSTTFTPLSQARGVRDSLLYTGANCVVNTARLVKVYVGGASGTRSQIHKQLRGLRIQGQHKR